MQHLTTFAIDDLPSESDLSTGTTLILPTSQNKSLNQPKTLTIRYKCNKCRNVFDNQLAFKSHQTDNCSSFSYDASSLDQEDTNTHKKKVLDDKQVSSLICNECGKQFFNQSELGRHMLHEHSSKGDHVKEGPVKNYRCYICSFEFTRPSNLRAHLLKVHPGDVGKLVKIFKSEDKKLKFEFDLGMQNVKLKLKCMFRS